MTTLAEIENATDALTPAEQQELFFRLCAKLRRSGGPMPEPRTFTREQIEEWVAQDEEDMRRFRAGE